jgi:hypothetical protein
MHGKNNFLAKIINLLVDMDDMVGAKIEQGLAQLRNAVESASGS